MAPSPRSATIASSGPRRSWWRRLSADFTVLGEKPVERSPVPATVPGRSALHRKIPRSSLRPALKRCSHIQSDDSASSRSCSPSLSIDIKVVIPNGTEIGGDLCEEAPIRKVRFEEEKEWEEPAWSDFMVRLAV
ncbi:hypothetical protein B0H17DRAFT_1209412 [Mycena rosella]|uniref:Uncharacterized protein n=1 Tax=Mycena rosella TaxID=1033263 RepID=A0AAD7GA28_MYCRO|nr:hypothetical protein B0H17DRAFT_1209412 [Mycena rosella]